MVYIRIKNIPSTNNTMHAYAYLCKTYWNGGHVLQKVVKYLGKVDAVGILDLKSISFDKCNKCNSTEKLTIDHIIPLSKGGTNYKDNLQVLCAKCNQKKGSS